ncbi:hypothetical protein BDN72DRAFT_843179 [Pluteus cervinus]|uniref:Uncharacterized protein n=1 Tax=Pluteus cervinus TaxID=181527 RepID=A0ACD3APG3_9AGAR|nr:hypothetical protein BDN72DRAFT_843179 [Pluteus cervinus]
MSVTSPNPRWNSPPPTYDTHMSSSTLTPYLRLPHLLSLTWLAYPIISLAFVAFRLQLSLASSQDAVANAKGDLLTSCKAAEQAATAAASMPRFMAAATNRQFAEAINGTMNGARAALILALTSMEAIINFLIDIYRSTFLCFLELVLRGGLAILIGAVAELNSIISSAADSIRTSIQNDVNSANSVIKSAIDAVNKINPFSDISAPTIPVPSLDALQNVTLPSSFQDSLTQLNNTLPTFNDLKDKIEAIISQPFELVKQDINDTFTNLTFDAAILPVPEENTVSFCNDLDLSVVDDLGRDLIKIAKIGTLILILLIFVLIGLNCLLEWYKWRCLKRHLEYTREAWMTDPTMVHPKAVVGGPQVTLSDHNLMVLEATMAHPLITKIVNGISNLLRLSPTQHTHLQWFFNYIFHAPALACFLIGFFGLLSVQLQLWAMGPLAAQYSDRAASAVADFSATIATSINNSMYNQSAVYAQDINGRVDLVQSTINDGVFGWVNGTTTTLNDTINEFYNDIQNAVSTAFGGTILEQPAQEFIRCLIGSKVDAIENALTFMHDNLKIDMPRVNQSVLVLSPSSVEEATRPIAAAAIGGGNNDDQGLIGRLIDSYAASLRKERIMFAIFMGLWGVVVFMGICVLLWHSVGKNILEKRNRRRWEREQRSGIDGIVIPFRAGANSTDEKQGGATAVTSSFPAMPSPRPFAVPNDTITSEKESTSEKSWDSFFEGREKKGQVKPISAPMKLMALGRKAMNKDRETTDKSNNPAWFGKMAGLLGKKQNDEESTFEVKPTQRPRPNLTISVERASGTREDLPQVVNSTGRATKPQESPLHSRWSPSPVAPKSGWLGIVSPTRKVTSHPPIGVPIVSRSRPSVDVPMDVDMSESPANPVFAPPLHHGFDSPRRVSNPRGILTKRDVSPPPPLHSPKLYQPVTALAPPPLGKHGRMASRPTAADKARGTHKRNWQPMTNINSSNQLDSQSGSVTPVTRYLTTTHARQSSSVNPFATPFDDNHRVTIDSTFAGRNGLGYGMMQQRTPMTAASTTSNPFTAIAL